MTVELRGSHGHLLPDFAAALVDLGHLPQTVTFCTDDVFPDHLAERGGLDHMIRRMIRHGLPVDWAYRAATLNAATRIGRSDLGVIAPGKRADLVLLDDAEQATAAFTVAGGTLVARDGRLTATAEPVRPPPALRRTVKTHALRPADFEIPATGQTARIATLSKPRFPVWGTRDVAVRDRRLVLPPDMIRMAVVNRHEPDQPVRVAHLEDWGTWRGAFASTVSHDSHNLTIFGRDPADMALAANTVIEADGGLAVASRGEVLASLALPLAGLVSDATLPETAAGFAAVRQALDPLVDWKPPYLVFKALFGASLVCNSGPSLSDKGIVDVFEDRILENCVIGEPDPRPD